MGILKPPPGPPTPPPPFPQPPPPPPPPTSPPPPPPPPPAPATATPPTQLIVNGALEGSISPWVLSGAGAFYTNNGNYPHGGTGYMYFGVNNKVSGQGYQTVTIPTTAKGNLNFWFNCSSHQGTNNAC